MQSSSGWWARYRRRVLSVALLAGGASLILVASALLLGGEGEKPSDGASAVQATATPEARSTHVPTPTPVSWLDIAQNWSVIAQMIALTPTPAPPPAAVPEQVSAPRPSNPQASQPVVLPPTPTPPPPPPPPQALPGCPAAGMVGLAGELFNAINQQRAQNGLWTLANDGCVTNVAQIRSVEMATLGYFSHTSPTGQGAFDLLDALGVPHGWAGENLARNNYDSSEAVRVAIEGLMASPAHRDNILSTNYTAMGVGHAVDASGMNYFTMVFIGPPL